MSASPGSPPGASALIHQRCAIHTEREASARCPECRAFYCRECVTEHEGRMLCTRCVARREGHAQRGGGSPAVWAALSAGGFLLAWLIFYYLGMGLARIPSSFHGSAP